MLADAGCPLGSQTVLLKGVNDDPAVMKRLMQELLRCRVRPYYLYQADLVAGGEHFRTSVAKGLEIIEALRGWTSGLAVPHFVIDAPGGGGKIPLLPQYVQSVTEREVVLRNYAGKTFRYVLPKPDDAAAPRATEHVSPPGPRHRAARAPESRGASRRCDSPLSRSHPTGRSDESGRAVTLRQGHPAPPELRAERLRVGPVEPRHALAQERRGRRATAAVAAPPPGTPPRSPLPTLRRTPSPA